jgi:hypothetical protein
MMSRAKPAYVLGSSWDQFLGRLQTYHSKIGKTAQSFSLPNREQELLRTSDHLFRAIVQSQTILNSINSSEFTSRYSSSVDFRSFREAVVYVTGKVPFVRRVLIGDTFYAAFEHIKEKYGTCSAFNIECPVFLPSSDVWSRPITLVGQHPASDAYIYIFGSSTDALLRSALSSLAHPFAMKYPSSYVHYHIRLLWWLPPLPCSRIIFAVSSNDRNATADLNDRVGGVFRSYWDQEIELIFRDFHDR